MVRHEPATSPRAVPNEELEYVPGRFIVNRIVRPRQTCTCCERFVQAPLPSRPIERGRPGPGLLTHGADPRQQSQGRRLCDARRHG
ncbi:IS66 family transposase zinc-finger binding domain-containing protein [Paracoccus sp. SSJ]|uniref:IS66 family transposase zinc-finger binding domain-containing protein n=1 Tax=Paracoccus sp. SSJ TaxID=3050636 RepID=UPI0033077E7F